MNQRWGTANPIMMRDPEFGPIRLRAFGSYNFRVQEDPIPFIKNVAGTSGEFTTEGISEQLRNFVITKFTDYLGESKIAALDLATNMNEFSQELTIGLKDDFAEYGIELTVFGREYFVARGCGRGIRPPHKHGRDWQYDRLYPDAVCRFVERFGKQSRRWQPCRRCDGCRYWTGYGRTNGGADDESTSRTVSRRATATSTGCTYSTPNAATNDVSRGSGRRAARSVPCIATSANDSARTAYPRHLGVDSRNAGMGCGKLGAGTIATIWCGAATIVN